MAFELAIRGGTVVEAEGRERCDLYVQEGKVATRLSPDASEPAAAEVDASGLLVLPGMVDTHVHFMEPGDPSREDFRTGSSAAALQGVTTIIEHTHGWPVTTVERLREKRGHLEGRSLVDFGLAAHVWPEHIEQIGAMWREGAAFFKAFTCETHGVPAVQADLLLELAHALAEASAICLVHCEDDLMTARNERRLRAAMRTDGGVIPEWRSREAEVAAAGAVAVAGRVTGARFIVAHASHPEVLEVLERERRSGSSVVAESCPQYLRLREDEVLEHGAFRKFTPPARIRSDDEERRMWAALQSGLVHHLSSDHAPATREQKLAGDIWEVHFGLPGIDTTMRLMLDAALRGRVSLELLVRLYSSGPARAYDLAAKGHLKDGADADLLLVEPGGTGVIRDEDVVSRAGWTPYAGTEVCGRVMATYLGGEPLVLDGELVAGRPRGRWLPGAGAAP